MNTLGLIFVLGAFLLGRQVVVGRVSKTPEDIRDITLALLSGDFDALSNTLAQRGENVTPDASNTVAVGASGVDALDPDNPNNLLTQGLGSSLLGQMVTLGNAAKGYVWGASGPTYYDCSGLVWQALKKTGQYKGARFTTSTFTKQLGNKITKVSTPAVGDVVLWPNHHIGVLSDVGQVYSAMSPSTGIGYSTIAGITKTVGVNPVYYRVNG